MDKERWTATAALKESQLRQRQKWTGDQDKDGQRGRKDKEIDRD